MSRFLEASVHLHNLMFFFVKGNRVEEDYMLMYIREGRAFVLKATGQWPAAI